LQLIAEGGNDQAGQGDGNNEFRKTGNRLAGENMETDSAVAQQAYEKELADSLQENSVCRLKEMGEHGFFVSDRSLSSLP
jgi:hypothetical protein